MHPDVCRPYVSRHLTEQPCLGFSTPLCSRAAPFSSSFSFLSLFLRLFAFRYRPPNSFAAIRNSSSPVLSRMAIPSRVSSFQSLSFFLLFPPTCTLCCLTLSTLHSYVFLAIFRFSFLLSNLSLDYLCSCRSPPLYILSRYPLSSVSLAFLSLYRPLVFAFWFRIFFCPSLSNSFPPVPRSLSLYFLFFFPHPPTSSVASFTTTLLSNLSFYFISHLPLSASFESAFPRSLFTSRSFSRIVPALFYHRFVLSPFSPFPSFPTATFSNSSLSASPSSIYFDRS